MPKAGLAKIFHNGRSQAVRLPKEFRFEGTEVRVSKVEKGVLLEPIISDPRQWFAELDRRNAEGSSLSEGRDQPVTPRRKIFD